MIQAEDRIARTGQTEICNIYYMYAEGAEIDEVLAEVLSIRIESINVAIDGGKGEDVNLLELVEEMLRKKAEAGGFIELKKFVPKKKSVKKPGKKVVVDKEVEQEEKPAQKEKSVGEKVKVIKLKVEEVKPKDYKNMSLEELESFAKKVGVTWKDCENKAIKRMRITMVLKKKLGV